MIIEKAYAKINLVLNVTKKREDGYHEVDFLMSTVKLHDKIIIEKAEVDEVICPRAPFIKKETNLAYLAYLKMKELYNLDGNIKITIHKVIPVSAGMAGGSSDAAAVIRGINKLYNLGLSYKRMAEIGAELGSDIPFCVYSKLARATGRGEQIDLIENNLPNAHVVVVNPGVALSTPKVYKSHVIEETQQDVFMVANATDFTTMVNALHNDLEKTAIKIEPKVKEVMEYMGEKYSERMMVSGSGPTVLLFTDDAKQAHEMYKYAKKKYKYSYYTEMRK